MACRALFLGMMLCVASAFGAQAASVVTLSPGSTRPTQAVTLSATGFGASEAVDVYLDTVDTLLLVSSASGTLSASLTLPASAQPGPHYVTAIGRKSGDAAQATVTVTTSRLEFGYGAGHLGFNPYENTVSTSNVSSLGLRWSVTLQGSGTTPAVVAGRVIVSTLQGIQSRQVTTGALQWSKLTTDGFYASPAVSGSTIYIGGNSGTFYALNTATGATLWSRSLDTTGAWYSSALVSGGAVYVGTFGGTVYALNATTGATLWSHALPQTIDSSPAVVNGILYIGCFDTHLYALDATTGAQLWAYTTGNAVESSPVVANGTVFFGSDDDNVYALRATDGALLWRSTTGGAVYSTPAVAYGSVFAGSADFKMYAYSARTGALQWSASTNGIVGEPAVANGLVYASSRDGTLSAFAASYGGILASGSIGYDFFGSPVVSDGVIYLSGSNANLSAVSLLGGTSAVAAQHGPPAIASLHPDYHLSVTP